MAGILESLASGLRQAGGVLNPAVQGILSNEASQDEAFRQRAAIAQMEAQKARERLLMEQAFKREENTLTRQQTAEKARMTAELGLARLATERDRVRNQFEVGMRNARTNEERVSVQNWYNSANIALRQQAAQIAASRAAYDVGYTGGSAVDIPEPPTLNFAAPSGSSPARAPSVAPSAPVAAPSPAAGGPVSGPMMDGGGMSKLTPDQLAMGIQESVVNAQQFPNDPAHRQAYDSFVNEAKRRGMGVNVPFPQVRTQADLNADARDLALKSAPQPTAPQPPAPQTEPTASKTPTLADAPSGLSPKDKAKWLLQQTKPSIAGAGVMNEETLKFTALQYLSGDRQAVQGYARNAATRVALQNEIVKQAREMKMSPEQVTAQLADYAGTLAGARSVGVRAAGIQLAATEAQEAISLVKETSDKFGRTNFVPFNMALKAFESNTGQPEVVAFGASINALVNTYARALSPSGAPTVSDKEHARAVLNAVQSPQQVDAVLGIINRELEIAKSAPRKVQEATRARVESALNIKPKSDNPETPEPPSPVWNSDKEKRYRELRAKKLSGELKAN